MAKHTNIKRMTLKLDDDLIEAAKTGSELELRKLITEGAKINTKDEHGKTPLMYTCENNMIEATRYLIKLGADIDAKDLKGWTPIIYSIFEQNYHIIDLLIESGANLEPENKLKVTALFHALIGADIKIIKTIIDAGGDLKKQDYKHKTPLMYAVLSDSNIASFLLNYDQDLGAVTKIGNTALHIAIMNENFEIASKLIDKMTIAQLSYTKPDGETYLSLIRKSLPRLEPIFIEKIIKPLPEEPRALEGSTAGATLESTTGFGAGAGAGFGAGAMAARKTESRTESKATTENNKEPPIKFGRSLFSFT
jgi:ankyrin repeat protein